EVGVEMSADVLGENGADVAFVLKRIELAGPHFYDREFGRDEKSVERDQPNDQSDLADENDWRVPVFSYRFGQGSGREKNKKQKVHGTDARRTPENPRPGVLPARLRHTRDEPARGEFSEGQARNLEPANERAAAAADFATIDHPSGAGIARQLRQGHIIFLRFELSTKRRIFLHGRALAFVAIDPGHFRHKGTRNVARVAGNANAFSVLSALDVRRSALDVGRLPLVMFPLNTDIFPATAAELERLLNESLHHLFDLARQPVELREKAYPHLDSLSISLDGAGVRQRPPAIPSLNTKPMPALTVDSFRAGGSGMSVGPAAIDFGLDARVLQLHQATDRQGHIVLLLQNAAEGHVHISAALSDLEALIAEVVKSEAGKHGVNVDNVRLSLRSRSPRSLATEVRLR